MKKVVFMLMLIGLTLSSYAVKIDSSSVVESKGLKIDSALYSDGKSALQNFTMQSGNALKTGYDIVVQQQRVIAIQYLLVGLLSVAMLVLFFVFYSKITSDKKNAIVPAVICICLFIWTAIVFSSNYSVVIQGLFNPDYAAIKEVVNISKQLMSK